MSAAYEPKSPAETALRAHGLAYPETKEDFPWGHRALKVKGKIFAIFGWDEGRFTLSTKLPHSNVTALDRPFAEPTHYGMGKHGWVTARFEPGERVPVDLLQTWIDESYRAIAPKKVLERLEGGRVVADDAPRAAKRAASARAPTRRATAKRVPVKLASEKRTTPSASSGEGTAKTRKAKRTPAKSASAKSANAKSASAKAAPRRAR
ncbi:MAG: MmcQ/YjbR family DNA-binding protein [Planctomycetes bacterium]|nr:MmcQ/YjbR family DNA-binding protein [Planctomycetota bacterium]